MRDCRVRRQAGDQPGRAGSGALEPVQYLGDRPERGARPSPHAATAALDRNGRVAGDAASIQRLVQLDDREAQLDEAAQFLARAAEEDEVLRIELGGHGDEAVAVDELLV